MGDEDFGETEGQMRDGWIERWEDEGIHGDRRWGGGKQFENFQSCTAECFRGATGYVCSHGVYPCGSKLITVCVCMCVCVCVFACVHVCGWVGGYSMGSKVSGSQKFEENHQKRKLENCSLEDWKIKSCFSQTHSLCTQPGFCFTWPSLKREAKSASNMMSSLNKTCWSGARLLR